MLLARLNTRDRRRENQLAAVQRANEARANNNKKRLVVVQQQLQQNSLRSRNVFSVQTTKRATTEAKKES